MADLGNIGLCMAVGKTLICRNQLTLDAQPTGNGPISNSAPFLADPNSCVNLNGLRGAQMDRVASFANPSGVWTFYDLSPGTYYATQAGASKQWVIEVAGDLTFTVLPVTFSFPVNASYGSIG